MEGAEKALDKTWLQLWSCEVERRELSLTRDCSLRCPEMAMMWLFEIPELDQRVMEVALTQ